MSCSSTYKKRQGSLSCRSLEDVVTTGYIPKKVNVLKNNNNNKNKNKTVLDKKKIKLKKISEEFSDDPLGLFSVLQN